MEEPAKEFARPQDLTAAVPTPSLVGRGQVEELQGAGKRACPALSVSLLMPADSPVHFAADVGELRNERHRMPSAAREIRVNRGGRHSETRSVTAARMRARMESSTTERDGFPCAGRTLIIESNSMKPSPCLTWSP